MSRCTCRKTIYVPIRRLNEKIGQSVHFPFSFFFFLFPSLEILLSSELVSVSNRVRTRRVSPGADQGVHTAEEENSEYSHIYPVVAYWLRGYMTDRGEYI